MGDDLMGFLSDFRSASAAKAMPAQAKPRTARAPSVPDPASGVPDYAPPAGGPTRIEEVPYYTPAAPGPSQERSGWALPEVDDFPYYAPPPAVSVVGPPPNWAPPQGSPVDWSPPVAYIPPARRRPPMWIIGAAVAGVTVLAGVVGMLALKSSPSLNGLTADQVMVKTIAAAHKAGTFHVDATESQASQVVHLSIDVGRGGGNIDSSMGGHSLQLRVVQGGVYLKGDAGALSQMGFSDSTSQQYSGQWLAVPTTTPDIQQMVQSLDANQIIDQFLHLSGPLTRAPSGRGGVVSLEGTVPDNQFNQGSGAGDTASMAISNKSPFVPVSISFSDPENGSTQMVFSRWGEHVALDVPPNAVPLPPGAGG